MWSNQIWPRSTSSHQMARCEDKRWRTGIKAGMQIQRYPKKSLTHPHEVSRSETTKTSALPHWPRTSLKIKDCTKLQNLKGITPSKRRFYWNLQDQETIQTWNCHQLDQANRTNNQRGPNSIRSLSGQDILTHRSTKGTDLCLKRRKWREFQIPSWGLMKGTSRRSQESQTWQRWMWTSRTSPIWWTTIWMECRGWK